MVNIWVGKNTVYSVNRPYDFWLYAGIKIENSPKLSILYTLTFKYTEMEKPGLKKLKTV